MHGPPVEEASHHETNQQIDELILAIQDLRRRVDALESRPQNVGLPVEPSWDLRAPAVESGAGELSSGLLSAVGRALLGIAGAYLLRAVTGANVIPQLAGTLAGVVYACAWLFASRRPRPETRWIAPLPGLTASVILTPLLWEATLRFHTLTPFGAASILGLFIVLGQILAWRRNLPALAGIVALAGSATAIALIMATLHPLPFAVALAIAAAAVEYGACRDRALGTRWIIALAADFCAFLLVYLLTRPQGLPAGYAPIPVTAVFAILASLVAVYLASITVRTLARGLSMRCFEIGQLAMIVALGIGSTLWLTHGAGAATLGIGVGCLAAAAGCYAASDISRLARNYHAYGAFALLLALVGSRLLGTGLPLAMLWSVLALVTAWFGERRGRNMLRVHGALYLTAAAVVSGLMNWSPPAASAALTATAAALVYFVILRLRPATSISWAERVPSAIVAGLLCWSLVALATGSAVTSRLPAALGCTLRTVMISSAAIMLAWIGSRWGLQELVWLLYPWMAFGAIKLILEDFSQGQSATLFVSLLVYGAALIALPRLLRRTRS